MVVRFTYGGAAAILFPGATYMPFGLYVNRHADDFRHIETRVKFEAKRGEKLHFIFQDGIRRSAVNSATRLPIPYTLWSEKRVGMFTGCKPILTVWLVMNNDPSL